MALESQQARILRRSLLSGMFLRLALAAALTAGCYLLFEVAFKAPVSDLVAAQTTSGWRLLNSTDQYEELLGAVGLLYDGASDVDPDAAYELQTKLAQAMADEEGREAASVFAEQLGAADDAAAVVTDGLEGQLATSDSGRSASTGGASELVLEIPDGMPYYLSAFLEDHREEVLDRAQEMGMSQDLLYGLLGECIPVSQEMAYENWSSLSSHSQALMLGLDVTQPVWQVSRAQDGQYEIRDVALYEQVADLEAPAFIGLLLVLCLVVIARTLNRAMRSFDELSKAVGGLLEDRNAPIELPDDLSVARNELALIQSKAQADERAAQQAEQRKNELVAYLAHDIRTPLTSVLGYLDLLSGSQGLPPETERRYARIAYDKAQRLESLVDEFFEITRYNLQSIPIERQNADVLLFCQQVADAFFPETSARGIDIVVDVPQGLQFFVDCNKLARALGNVMRNAVAYAEDGTRITLRAVVEKASGSRGTDANAEGSSSAREDAAIAIAGGGAGSFVLLSVSNQGREISAAHLQSIFEKFFREDGARSTGSGGAGLGLAVAKEIVDAHGGSIFAESRNGLTTFSMRLPLGGWLQG